MKVLSVDAWAEPGGGWSWNEWHHVGNISKEEFESLTDNRKIIAWFREEGFLGDGSRGKVAVDDDQYNIVIVKKSNRQPLFAIEYGNEEGW